MKKRIACIAAVFVLVAATGLVLANTETGKIFHNKMQTSFVQVNVQQLEQTEHGIQEAAVQRAVQPGEKSSYIPRVTVQGRDSYVRLRFDVAMNDANSMRITAKNVYGLNEDWINKGNCFYCRKVLKPGEYSDVFQGIRIPQAGNGERLGGFQVTITADAVQSDHFTPDFENAAPWGNISIQRSKEYGNLEKRVAVAVKNDELDFMDGNSIECTTDNLFSNFSSMTAGDTQTDHMQLRNLSNSKRDIYFRTENTSTELLQQVRLHLTCGSFEYDGDLASEDLASPVRIASLESGETRDLTYTLTLPASSDNQFQSLADNVVWIFDSAQGASVTNVKTGDEIWVKAVIAILICACAALSGILLLRRRNNEEDDDDYF